MVADNKLLSVLCAYVLSCSSTILSIKLIIVFGQKVSVLVVVAVLLTTLLKDDASQAGQ